MKRFLTTNIAIIILIAFPLFARANEDYSAIAGNFLAFLKSDKEIESIEIMEASQLEPLSAPVPIAALVHLAGGGYILMSASRDLTPIKAYSLNASFETLPEAYRTFLLRELEHGVWALAYGSRAPLSSAILENRERWEFLALFGRQTSPLSYTPGVSLLKTRWNQGHPYNKFLPEINGEKTVTGCVNTAIGQVMRYYGHPHTGNGVASFTWNGCLLKTILYRDFNWENMPDVLDAATPDYKIDEVALLMRDLGITNKTNFDVTGSSTLFNKNTLYEYFGFANPILTIDNSDQEAFFSTIRSEIDAMRPVLIDFPGHLAVADGYAHADPTGRNIHINMGWGGHNNDYYYLDAVVQAGQVAFDPGHGFRVHYNLKPCSGNDCVTNLEPGDDMAGSTINGIFHTEKDTDKYTVYFKGATSVSGSRGHSNIAFFISVYDVSSNAIIYSLDSEGAADEPVSLGNMTPGKYVIQVSLCNDGLTSCYNLNDKEAYTVNLSTDALSDSEKEAIDGACDKPPVIGNDFSDFILNSTQGRTYMILVDVRDENGDTVTLGVNNSNPEAVQTSLDKNILSVAPVAGASKTASKITVSATAKGHTVEKSFVVLVNDDDVSFGKSFEVKGTFENQTAVNTHKMILDGRCAITGYNGFSNQAFFTSVKDKDNNPVIGPTDQQIVDDFNGEIYVLGASLRGEGVVYPYEAGVNDRYFLNVRCPSANIGVRQAATLLGIDLSGITEDVNKIVLSRGWNFISLPIEPSDTAIHTVLKDVSPSVRIAWGYDNESKEWKIFKPDGKNNDLSDMEIGRGYWIYMNEPKSLTIGGDPPVDPQALTLYEGWNLVGYCGVEGYLPGALSALSGKWIILWGWDTGIWRACVPPGMEGIITIDMLTEMNRGKAYWILMNEEEAWRQ